MEAQGVGELERLVSFAGGLSVIYLLGARLEGQLVPNVAGRELGLLVLVLADQSDGRRQTPGDLELLVHRFGAGQNAFQGTRRAVIPWRHSRHMHVRSGFLPTLQITTWLSCWLVGWLAHLA